MNELLLVRVRLNIVGVVEQYSALAKKADMVLVAVLVQRDQEVRLVSRRENLARSDAHLKMDGPPEIVDGIVM